jgi:ATP-binding protein involved in chromosome partitioning
MTESPAGPKIVPLKAHGVSLMSLGSLLDPEKAVAWRGPMVAGAVRQLLSDVTWNEQDYLIVDLPPGTGDAPMTLAQQVPLSGVVLVMTPQQVAQEIANKSVLMFRMLEQATGRPIPVLGVVENMSGSVFGSGGGETAAERLGVPFLGRVPLDADICEGGDSGQPIITGDSPAAAAFRSIASSLASRLSILEFEGRS